MLYRSTQKSAARTAATLAEQDHMQRSESNPNWGKGRL